MNIDIRNLDNTLTEKINAIKSEYDYINTNIDAAKHCISNYSVEKLNRKNLEEENSILREKLHLIEKSMKVLGMSFDHDKFEKERSDNKRLFNETFFSD